MTEGVVRHLNAHFGPALLWTRVPLVVDIKVGPRWGSMCPVPDALAAGARAPDGAPAQPLSFSLSLDFG